MHLALDQVLTEEVGAGRRGPTLRFWEWDRSTVVIGSFQSLRNEVDLDAAEREGFQVVRRISGGGAMFIEEGSGITYSLYAPGDLVCTVLDTINTTRNRLFGKPNIVPKTPAKQYTLRIKVERFRDIGDVERGELRRYCHIRRQPA